MTKRMREPISPALSDDESETEEVLMSSSGRAASAEGPATQKRRIIAECPEAAYPPAVLKRLYNVRFVQKRTARNKPGVYIGVACATGDGLQRGSVYVVKGSFGKSCSDKEIVLKKSKEDWLLEKTQKLKVALGLPHANGRRVNWDGERFFVSDFIQGSFSAEAVAEHSSYIERNMLLWTGDHCPLNPVQHLMDPKMGLQTMLALLFLHCIGANDINKRNFVVYDNKVYTADDAAKFINTPMVFKSPVSRHDLPLFMLAQQEHFEAMTSHAERWPPLARAILQGDEADFFCKRLSEWLVPSRWIWCKND